MDFSEFSSLFSNIWAITLVILFFGGSIFVHELGHFLAAKKRGLKIDRFSIGFGPKIISWKKDGIEYCISLLPLGGYVALPQIANMGIVEEDVESFKKAHPEAQDLPPISYADKMIVAVMGAVFNVIFAFVLACGLWMIGKPASYEQLTNQIGYVAPELTIQGEKIAGPAYQVGVLPGDVVHSVDGIVVKDFESIRRTLALGAGRDQEGNPETVIQVKRNGELLEFTASPQLVELNPTSGDRLRMIGIFPRQNLSIGSIFPNSPAEKAGFQIGDQLIEADGTELYSLATLSDILNRKSGEEVLVTLERSGEKVTYPLVAQPIPFMKPTLKVVFDASQPEDFVRFAAIFDKTFTGDRAQADAPAAGFRIVELGKGAIAEKIDWGMEIENILEQEVTSLAQIGQLLQQDANSNLMLLNQETGREITLTLTSGYTAEIEPAKSQPMLGIGLVRNDEIIHTPPHQLIYESGAMTLQTLRSLIHPKSDIGVQNLMGPPGIIRTLHTFSIQDFRLLLWFIIVLNINLAILNLLPIPVLDGGHMLFATLAQIRGKSLPISLIGSIQGAFMLMLFSMMIYVSFFDIRRWQGDNQIAREIQRQEILRIPVEFR